MPASPFPWGIQDEESTFGLERYDTAGFWKSVPTIDCQSHDFCRLLTLRLYSIEITGSLPKMMGFVV